MKNFRKGALSQFQDDTLFVRSTGYCEQDNGYREAARQIDFGEFFWCAEGRGIFFLGKRRYILRPGEVFFYPPGSTMDFYPDKGGWSHYFIALGGEAFPLLLSTLGLKAGKKHCGRVPEELFDQLLEGLSDPDPAQRIPMLSVGMQILFKIAQSQSDRLRRQESPAEKAKALIEQNFSDPDFNIGSLAWKLAVHRVTLCRDFKKSYGVTPQDFLAACRFSRATYLLQESKMTIKEIAFACGFSSQEYFSTAFSKKFGHPPTLL